MWDTGRPIESTVTSGWEDGGRGAAAERMVKIIFNPRSSVHSGSDFFLSADYCTVLQHLVDRVTESVSLVEPYFCFPDANCHFLLTNDVSTLLHFSLNEVPPVLTSFNPIH